MSNNNPYAPPGAEVADTDSGEFEYAGFWIRTLALLIDSVVVSAVTFPLLYAVYGAEYFNETKETFAGPAEWLISWVFPAVATVVLWHFQKGTPGKLLLSLRIVDATTGQGLSWGQSIGRYFGYILSFMPLGLGLLWVVFDRRKQAWHDKVSNAVVVRVPRPVKTVAFKKD